MWRARCAGSVDAELDAESTSYDKLAAEDARRKASG